MQLQVSLSMRIITISNNNVFIDLMKITVAATHISYRTLFHTILILTFLLPFSFILTAFFTLEDCLGRRLGPRILGRVDDSGRLVKDLYMILNQVNSEEIPEGLKLPDSFSHLVSDMKNNQYDAKTFALMLRATIMKLETEIMESRFSELMNKHFAASSIPRDNILAASVVVTSAVESSLEPSKIVFHIITDKKTYAAMHSWFALNLVSPAIVEVKGVHQFDWLTRENVPLLDVVDNHNDIKDYYHGSHITETNLSDTTRKFASKLEVRSPKYISLLNHLRIYLPKLFPGLEKVIFLDDDVVIQCDLSPLLEIDLHGKVNGAVETCKGEGEWVMSKRFKNYFNFPILL
ncbi:hypothetical protein ES319_A09G010900v1 [Gossypium barbadense]|uniref:Hexosyltransferase n=1 Tax=Gossypium barbadense TaxID=3634 RepID=A0A5J5U9W2_GOSBA|nr:hypothetical protein ES319_A09G010900v1 [Gossypium barbadense]